MAMVITRVVPVAAAQVLRRNKRVTPGPFEKKILTPSAKLCAILGAKSPIKIECMMYADLHVCKITASNLI